MHIGGIPKMMYRLDQIQGTNYCLLVAKRYIDVAAKNEEPFCFSRYRSGFFENYP